MLKELFRSLVVGEVKQVEKFNNLLNQILYQYQINNNGIVWFDTQNRSKYIQEGYQANATVYAIVNKIATKLVAADLQVFRNRPDGKGKYKRLKQSKDPLQIAAAKAFRFKELEAVDSETDPLRMLLRNPNKTQAWGEFLNLVSVMYETTGEVFIYRVTPGIGRNKDLAQALYVMPSDLTDLVGGDWRNPVSGYKLRIGQTTLEIPYENVLHLKKPNPHFDLTGTQLRGMPPLMAGYKLVTANSAAIEALTRTLQNEGVKGIVVPDVQDPKYWLQPEQKVKLDQRLEEQANGSDNRNRIISASMPLKFVGMGLSPSNMALAEALEMTDKPLANLWGLNPVLFDPNATLANLSEAKKQLVTDVCIPFLNTLEEKLMAWLVPPFKAATGIDYVLDFDTTIYPELQPDMEIVAKVYGNNPAFTWNELRAMLNWEASQDPMADKHWVSSNLIPADDFSMDGKADYRDYLNA
jgi:phage portal protein BeeE